MQPQQYSSRRYNHNQHQHQHHHQHQHVYQDTFDTRSVISEPPISRQIILQEIPCVNNCVVPLATEQPKIIRKYRTTKTTTTTQPVFQQGYQMSSSQSANNSYLAKDDQFMEPMNALNNVNSNSSRSQFTNRSSSIPPNQRCQFDENLNNGNVCTSSTIHEPGSTTKRYFKSSNYTTSNVDQLQQQQYLMQQQQQSGLATTPRHTIEKKTKSEQYQNDTTNYVPSQSQTNLQQRQTASTTSTTNNRTLPVNYNNNQQATTTTNGTLNSNGTTSSSCIDYSNTHYNSDWTMRHAGIEKPQAQLATATSIPIFQHPIGAPTSTTTTTTTFGNASNANSANNSAAFSSMKVR